MLVLMTKKISYIYISFQKEKVKKKLKETYVNIDIISAF